VGGDLKVYDCLCFKNVTFYANPLLLSLAYYLPLTIELRFRQNYIVCFCFAFEVYLCLSLL